MIPYDLEYHDEGGYLGIDTKIFAEKLIEFAKFHVEAALKKASENDKCQLAGDGCIPMTKK